MEANLGTTNLLLGIMAGVSLLEALALIGLAIGGWMMYRRVMNVLNVVEQRHVTPAMVRVNAILDDVRGVTGRVKSETDRVDDAIRHTMDRVDDTADRVRWSVRAKTGRLVGLARGLRVALEEFLQTRDQPPASAGGRI